MASQSTSTLKALFWRKNRQISEPPNSVVAITLPRRRDKFQFQFKSLFRRKTPLPPESSIAAPPPPIRMPSQSSNDNVAPTMVNVSDIPPPVTPISPESLNGDTAPTAPNVLHIPPSLVSPQKPFAKSNTFERDISILSMTYILAKNPELKRLIHVIVGIHEKDEEAQFIGILETCTRFSVQLASAIETQSAEATEAISQFVKTVEEVNRVHIEGNVQSESLDALTRMVDGDIAKIKSSHPELTRDCDFGTSDRLSKVLTATIGTSIAVLDVVKAASAVIPVPLVQTAIGGILSLLNAVSQTRSNYNDMRQIAAAAGEFVVSCAVIFSDRTIDPPKELKRALNKFTKTLQDIAKECDELSRLNPFWRYFQQNLQKNTLQGIRTSLDDAIKLFLTESQLDMRMDINDLSKKFDYAALNSLPNHPHYVRNEYLGGSRDGVLEYIARWIDKPAQTVLWMHGAAGLGKSTVGQQLVRLLKEDDRLAGGVFLTNLTKEPPETVIQMISKQLGELHPRAIADIAEAARKLNGPHNSLQDYFTAYIIDPIRHLKYPYPLVVVVDGLEEWTNHESFLAELAHIPPSSAVKFILASRPSYSIERVLNKIPVQQYPLPLVSQEIVEHYFTHHFQTIDWRGRKPDQPTINRLATHAHGLLIWAATVRSLLSHKFDMRRPHEILDQILSSEEKVGARSGEQLERLYRGAIAGLFPEPDDVQEKLRDFLGATMVLQEPLLVHDFARLLGMPVHLVEEIHQRLASFQTRDQFKNEIVLPAIQQFHMSFLEFMESTSTVDNRHSMVISTANAHSMLGNRCLEIVFSESLQSYRGKVCASSELRGVELYAIKFWPLHFSNGSSRLPPSTPSTTNAPIDMISEEDMRRWAAVFLPCVAIRFQNGRVYDSLDNVPRSSLLYELAMIIGNDDVTTLSYQLYCLEIAARLQPMDIGTWTALGEAYDRLYRHGKYKKTLDEEINVLRHASELASRNSAGQGPVNVQTNTGNTVDPGYILSLMALALESRSKQGNPDDIDESISLHRRVLALHPVPRSGRSLALENLAKALRTRFEWQGTQNDLDEAISLHYESFSLWPAPHPDRSSSLENFAVALQTRFRQQGAIDDLNKSILLHREALVLRIVPHPDRSTTLGNLATALVTRFKEQRGTDDLDEAILLHQEALALQPVPHPDRSISLNNLADALCTRFEYQGVMNDLNDAILLHHEALALLPTPHPDHAQLLGNLANALLTRFEKHGAPNDLDKSISLQQEALVLRPAPHPKRPMTLSSLATALFTRFEKRDTTNDLDEAISLHREALVLQPAPHPDRSYSLNILANALRTRFYRWAVRKDLDEAILLLRQVLVLRPAPHPHHLISLNNLATGLETCFQLWHAPNDLDEAILLYQKALIFYSAPHPDRPTVLENLAAALKTRFQQRGTIDDLDKANSLLREAETLVLRPSPHLNHSAPE